MSVWRSVAEIATKPALAADLGSGQISQGAQDPVCTTQKASKVASKTTSVIPCPARWRWSRYLGYCAYFGTLLGVRNAVKVRELRQCLV